MKMKYFLKLIVIFALFFNIFFLFEKKRKRYSFQEEENVPFLSYVQKDLVISQSFILNLFSLYLPMLFLNLLIFLNISLIDKKLISFFSCKIMAIIIFLIGYLSINFFFLFFSLFFLVFFITVSF